jgi:long-chain acyl-CoA synthetase
LAFLQYTGGTTGVSKGAELTHGNMVANLQQAKSWVNQQGIAEGKEIILTALPMYHIFSLTANAFAWFSWGACNVLIPNPRDFVGFINELKKWKFTAITGVNTLFRAMMMQEGFKDIDFTQLRVTLGGGMAVQKSVADEWQKKTGCVLLEAYGLTETSPAACINPSTISEFNGYVGLPIASTYVAIKNDAEENLSFNQVGEICIKGPQVTKGYWNKPEETKNAFSKDGYFKTGDLGFMNDQGYVKIVDRKKDMILVINPLMHS